MKKVLLITLVLMSFSLAGCSRSNSDARELTLFNSSLLAVEEDGSYGYINKTGEVEIAFLFDEASAFYDGLAVVKVNNQMHIINTNGDYLLDKGYDRLYHDLNTGNFLFLNNGKWGMMNKRGKILIEALYDKILAFNDGLARVTFGDKNGFIDKDGKVVIDIEHYLAGSFINGYAIVVNEDNEWGAINKKGEVIIALSYNWISEFDDFGNVIVREETSSGNKFSLINESGTILFDAVDMIKFSGVFYAIKADDEIKLYNPDETRFNDNVYDNLWYTSGYAANLEFDGEELTILFDENGKVIVQADYNQSYFDTYLIDGKKETVLVVYDGDEIEIYYGDNNYRFTADYLEGIISADEFILPRNGKIGVVDKDGEIILQFLYNSLFYTNDGYFVFETNGKMGVMNSEYETIIAAEYNNIILEPNIVWIF